MSEEEYRRYEPVPIEHPLGRRVIIVGRPGKTTLGKAIAQKHNLTFIEIDWVKHRPNWNERPVSEARDIVSNRMAESELGWVFDGNDPYQSPLSLSSPHARSCYGTGSGCTCALHGSGLIDTPLAQADSVILIQIPWLRTLWTYTKRSIRRSWTGEEIAGGNRETFLLNFASRESHLWNTFKTRKRNYRALMEPQIPDGVSYYVIDSWKKLHKFYETHELPRQPSISSREAASDWLD